MTAHALQFISIGPWDFNGFDVAVLIILLISMLYAASRGLLREVVSIAALLVAAIATLFAWGQFRYVAQDLISPSELADGALLVGVFFLVYLMMVLIMGKIGKSIAGKEPGFIDRILGAAFGIARGLIIAALGVLVLTSGRRAMAEAQDYKKSLIEQGIYEEVLKKMPKSMRDQMEKDQKPLGPMLADSTFYPLLDKIGAGLRALPFAKVKTYAERIKDGDIDGITEDLLESGQ